MKALVKAKAEPGLRLEDVPVPALGRDDVLIRVLRTGVCGTDLHIYDWDGWARANVPVPLVIGHEFAGEVVDIGSDVQELRPGDLVSGEGHLVCGRCRNCMAGRRVQCAHTKGVGVNRPGAFAEYIALPATNVWRHEPDIDLDVAAIFDPFGNAVHSALTFPVLGEDVLITGAGPIGLMAAIVARHAGARYVAISDVSEYRLDLARRIGVTLAVNTAGTGLGDVMAELGMREGFDVGLEMSGKPAALREMLDSMTHGGKIAMLGLPAEDFGDRLVAPGDQHDHDQGHLRAPDVRDLVRDVGADPFGPRHFAGHHAQVRCRRFRAGLRHRAQRPVRQGGPHLGSPVNDDSEESGRCLPASGKTSAAS